MPALPFFKLSPGGNTTVLIADTSLSHTQQAACAPVFLNPLHLHAEQVGFIHTPTANLHMAGGEFCVNATRALGAVLARQGLLRLHKGLLCGTARVSGMDTPIELEVVPPVTQAQNASALLCTWDVTAVVALPHQPTCQQLAPGMVLVRLPGIVHLIIDAHVHAFPHQHWEAEAARLRQRFELETQPAVGCIWCHSSADKIHAHPVVWVRELNSTCYESACGSGALACALVLRQEQKENLHNNSNYYSIMQPSGKILRVSCSDWGQGLHMRVGGPVSLIAEGTVYIEE